MLCVRGEAGGERDAEPGDNHRQDPRGEDTQGKFGQCFLGSLKPGGKGGCSKPWGGGVQNRWGRGGGNTSRVFKACKFMASNS